MISFFATKEKIKNKIKTNVIWNTGLATILALVLSFAPWAKWWNFPFLFLGFFMMISLAEALILSFFKPELEASK